MHYHALHVLDADLDVLVEGLLREIDHVGGEERLAVGLEVLLVGLEHAVEPGEELLGAVVRVEHHRHAVGLGDIADVVGALQPRRQSTAGPGGPVEAALGLLHGLTRWDAPYVVLEASKV